MRSPDGAGDYSDGLEDSDRESRQIELKVARSPLGQDWRFELMRVALGQCLAHRVVHLVAAASGGGSDRGDQGLPSNAGL